MNFLVQVLFRKRQTSIFKLHKIFFSKVVAEVDTYIGPFQPSQFRLVVPKLLKKYIHIMMELSIVDFDSIKKLLDENKGLYLNKIHYYGKTMSQICFFIEAKTDKVRHGFIDGRLVARLRYSTSLINKSCVFVIDDSEGTEKVFLMY